MDPFTSLWDDASADIEAEASLRALTSARVAVAGSWPFLAAAVDRRDLSNRLALVANQISEAAAAQGLTAEALGATLVADWEQMQSTASFYVTDNGKKVGGPYDTKDAAQEAISGGDVEGDNLSVSSGDDGDSDSDSGDDEPDDKDVNGDGETDSDGDGQDDDQDEDDGDEKGKDGGNPFAKKESVRKTAAGDYRVGGGDDWMDLQSHDPGHKPTPRTTLGTFSDCTTCGGGLIQTKEHGHPHADKDGWTFIHVRSPKKDASKVAFNDAEESQASSERATQMAGEHHDHEDEDDEFQGHDYADDDQDPHYGRDAHWASKKTASHEPIGYTYEADVHCPSCAEERHGRSARGFIGEDAHDGEGNPVGVIAPWDETHPHGEHCGTCHERISEPYDHNPAHCGVDTCSGVVKDGRVLQYPGPRHHGSLFPVIALEEGVDPLAGIVEQAPDGEGEPEAVATHTTQFTSQLDRFAAVLRQHTGA